MLLKSLEKSFLKRLALLKLASRRASLMSMQGDLYLCRRGSSIEFMEYKEYALGDDFKAIDWNIYGRLDRLYLKLYQAEHSLNLYILLDASKSMHVPRKDRKFEYAQKTALALAYVGLLGNHRVKLMVLGGSGRFAKKGHLRESPFFTGAHSLHYIERFLEDIHPEGIAKFSGIRKNLHKLRDIGTAVVISDFMMEPQEYKLGISFLCYKRFDISVIHVIGEIEQDPFRRPGRLKLEDIETQEEKVISITDKVREQFRQAFAGCEEMLKNYCISKHTVYTRAITSQRVEDFVLKELPKMRLLR